MASSGDLITRKYTNLRGIDLRKGEISLNRSSNALNLYKNYKSSNTIETRPEIELLMAFDNPIYGLFFYELGLTSQLIVHSGTKLYKVVDNTKTEITPSGVTMKAANSCFFVYANILYIKDGLNYLQYNGTTCSEVVGYVPTTTIGRKPAGGGTTKQDVNMLSDYRINTFLADGTSTDYYLDAQNITGVAEVKVDNVVKVYNTDYTVNLTTGCITFTTAPSVPATDGEDNVEIKYQKTVSGYADRILKCTILEVFDNRIFFSGNQNYPNVVWHSSLDDPTYCSDLDYYDEGLDLSPVKSMVAGNNALWVFKEPSQANTTIFYHVAEVDSEKGVIYSRSHSNISTGCVATAINFNDDICFFSDRGMEGISGDITTEQVVNHRSSFIDSKLLSESNYKYMKLCEWEGYLMVFIDNHVYLADSRQISSLNNSNEYEWYYWELSKNVTDVHVQDGVLYIGTSDGIYTLTGDDDVSCYWETPVDNFGYGMYQKVTNKKGFVIECEGDVSVYAKTNLTSYQLLNSYTDVTDYVAPKIKLKKFKDCQIKISSSSNLKLESITLEAYLGAFIKR